MPAEDLAVSLPALLTVNDLPGARIKIRRALKPNGLAVAALVGGNSQTKLRQSLTIAAYSEHVFPIPTVGCAPRRRPVAFQLGAARKPAQAARPGSATTRLADTRNRPG